MQSLANSPNNEPEGSGYSYFSFGIETITYEERLNRSISAFDRDIPFNLVSDGEVASPTIRTGGLYYIDESFDFSMDSSATFAPAAGDESWFMTIDIPEVNITGTNRVQENVFTFTDATTTGLLQFKLNPMLRVVGGAEFALHTFKRFDFESLSPLVVIGDNYTEETVANVNLMAGIAFESGELKRTGNTLSAKLLVGLPVWVDVVNSSNTDVTFSEAGGYSLLAEARYSFSISQGMNIGVFTSYRVTERDEQEDSAEDGRLVFIPEATTTGLAVGLSVVWDL
jgi:hypothetical protein